MLRLHALSGVVRSTTTSWSLLVRSRKHFTGVCGWACASVPTERAAFVEEVKEVDRRGGVISEDEDAFERPVKEKVRMLIRLITDG